MKMEMIECNYMCWYQTPTIDMCQTPAIKDCTDRDIRHDTDTSTSIM